MDTTRPTAVSRRTALAGLGAGGLGLALAARAFGAAAQEASPTVSASAAALPPSLQEWVAGWEAADAGRIAGAYAADATVEVVPFGTTLHGRDAIRQYYLAYFGAFAEPTPEITDAFATAERAAAEWTFRGRYTGQLPGLPPGSGQAVAVRGANVMTLRDGQIAEEHIYTDLAGFLAQLGLGPAGGTPVAATPTA